MIHELPAVHKDEDYGCRGPAFTLLPHGETVIGCAVPEFFGNRNPQLFFPCHTACVKIAKMATASAIAKNFSSSLDLCSVQLLWKVLVAQWESYIRRNKVLRGSIMNLCDARRYGNLCYYQELEWDEPPKDEAKVCEGVRQAKTRSMFTMAYRFYTPIP